MVKVFTHGVMGRWIDRIIVDPLNNFSQYSTTGVTKAVVCAILSVGWCISRTLAANQRVAHVVAAHFIYSYMASEIGKDHSDSERGNPLQSHGLLGKRKREG